MRSRGQAWDLAVITVLDGESPPLDELLAIDIENTPIPIDRSDTGPRRDELPLGRDLVTFANVRS